MSWQSRKNPKKKKESLKKLISFSTDLDLIQKVIFKYMNDLKEDVRVPSYIGKTVRFRRFNEQ